MGQKFVITEEDRNRIRGLYEQTAPSQVKQPFNLFTYRDTISNIRTKPNGGLLNSIVSDIFGTLNVQSIPMCGQQTKPVQ